MNFKHKQIKGVSAKHYKEWYDETRQYRVLWRNEAFGVAVTPGFYACVRCSRPGSEYWGFVGRRGLYRTLTSAMDACDRNRQIWDKFLAISGKAKVRQVKELKEYAIFGSGNSSYSMMSELPVWMMKQAPARLLEILCGKNPSDPMDGPAYDASAPEPSSPTTEECDARKTPARPAKAQRGATGKKSAKRTTKRTTKRSTNGKKPSKRAISLSKSGKLGSSNSRKKKSKPSKS